MENKKNKNINRFHIDIRSNTMVVGDMEWAKILFIINNILQKDFPHIEAHLESLSED